MMNRFVLILLVMAFPIMAGCTEDDTADTTSTSDSEPVIENPDIIVQADLTVTVFADSEDNDPEISEVVCPPDDEDMVEECVALAANPQMLAPLEVEGLCTEIYGGSQTAVIEGTFEDRPIKTEYSRRNGCEIAHWDAASALLGDVGAEDDVPGIGGGVRPMNPTS